MPIQIQCSGCLREYSLKESFAGKKIRCKDCGTVVQVPTTAGDRERPAPHQKRRRSRDAEFHGHELDAMTEKPERPPVRPRRRRPSRQPAVESDHPGSPRPPVDAAAVLSAGEITLAILCSGAACLISLIYLLQGKPKAAKYVGLAFLCGLVHLGLFMLLLLLGQSGQQP